MISIIICSISFELANNVQKNIKETIGVVHEIIVFDNNFHKYSIAKVYNLLLQQAKFETVCFIHEDLVFKSDNWGVELIETFKDDTIGLIGGWGSVYKSKYPSTWPICAKSLYRVNPADSNVIHASNSYDSYNSSSEVVVIDGAFMASKKSILQKNGFDDNLLTGFHCYDLDISLRIHLHFKVVVSHKIHLIHLSKGNTDINWLEQTERFTNKWKNKLSMYVKGSYDESIFSESDYYAASTYLSILLNIPAQHYKIIKIYIEILLKYFRYNKFKYSKLVINYLLLS